MVRRLAYIAISVAFGLGVLELGIRSFIPASSLLQGEDRLKMWFLENVEELRDRGRHPRHIADPHLGWTLRPDLRLPGETSNSHGLRGSREFSLKKDPKVRRGMFVGDSFTYGAYVKDSEVFTSQVDGLLPNFEILNLGVNAYGTDQQLMRWLRVGRRYDPDFVVLAFYVHDFHRNVTSWRGEAPKPRYRVVGETLELVGEGLPSLENLDENRARIAADLRGVRWTPRLALVGGYAWRRIAAKLRDHREPDETFEEKAKLAGLIIRKFQETCAEQGARFAVVSIPMELPNYPDEGRIEDVLAGSCKRAGVPFLRLTKTLGVSAEALGDRKIYDSGNGHWTAFGHQVAGTRIVDFLKRSGFLD